MFHFHGNPCVSKKNGVNSCMGQIPGQQQMQAGPSMRVAEPVYRLEPFIVSRVSCRWCKQQDAETKLPTDRNSRGRLFDTAQPWEFPQPWNSSDRPVWDANTPCPICALEAFRKFCCGYLVIFCQPLSEDLATIGIPWPLKCIKIVHPNKTN